MTEIRFAAEVRSAEDKLLARLPEGELMARASAGLAATCARLLRSSGGVYGAQVVLLVGSGNNGADALYAGAALARRGARTNAVSVGSGETHDGGTTALLAAGGRFVSAEAATGLLLAADLVVDGIVGLGNHGPLTPEAAVLANAAVAGGGLRVAVDLPSGVLADTGEIPDPAAVFRANVTVTFGARKPAHVLWPAAELAGVVEVIDIGLAGNWDEPASW
ncbi:MAG: NAD(P)H-hydrate epimerase, partial [Actinomycetes bacterium]